MAKDQKVFFKDNFKCDLLIQRNSSNFTNLREQRIHRLKTGILKKNRGNVLKTEGAIQKLEEGRGGGGAKHFKLPVF